jgi:hypothetical protein
MLPTFSFIAKFCQNSNKKGGGLSKSPLIKNLKF